MRFAKVAALKSVEPGERSQFLAGARSISNSTVAQMPLKPAATLKTAMLAALGSPSQGCVHLFIASRKRFTK
jgi:hypothetical protein